MDADFNLEKFVLDAVKRKVRPFEMVQELNALGITRSRKSINNKIADLRRKGYDVPLYREMSDNKEEVMGEVEKKEGFSYKCVEPNILPLPTGSYKVSKSINGVSYQKVFKTIEAARKFKENLEDGTHLQDKTKESLIPVEKAVTSPIAVKPQSSPVTPQPKISKLAMTDIFEKDEKFIVIIGKDKNMLSNIIDRILG